MNGNTRIALFPAFVPIARLPCSHRARPSLPSPLESTGTTIRKSEDSNLHRGNVFLEPARLDNYYARLEFERHHTASRYRIGGGIQSVQSSSGVHQVHR